MQGLQGQLNIKRKSNNKKINLIHCINRKGKNVIAIYTEKAFDKIQPIFIRSTHRKLGVERSILDLINNIYKKYTAKLISSVKY